MPFFPLAFPPGVSRLGTEYQSKGRFYDSNLVRWFEGSLRPIGGWRAKTTSAMTGKCRALLTWKNNEDAAWIAAGTHSHLYVFSRADVAPNDITPSGFTVGREDASLGGGYGTGTYGTGEYGTPRPDDTNILDATVWTLDTFGELLLGCSADDGKIYSWSPAGASPTATDAAQLTNSPTQCRGVVVTEENFVVALGAGGNPRKIEWSDQENATVWTPASTNQAGGFQLVTPGRLMTGKRVEAGTLLLTDVDAHLMTYVGRPLVYEVERIGTGCGAISQGCVAEFDSRAVWMSQNGFWTFNGTIQPLPCEVSDYVFTNLNRNQQSKVTHFHNSTFGEVWWFYPDQNSLENNRYVVWNYRENHWAIGALARTAGSDRGVLVYPIMVGSDGIIYEHEVGLNYGGDTPYAETGPLEIGGGDNIVHVREIVTDDKTLGDVNVRFRYRAYPNADAYSELTTNLTASTKVRFRARQVSVRYEGARSADWRVGVPRLEGVLGGRR